MTTLSFQGVEGSYSHQALLFFLEQSPIQIEEPIKLIGHLISEDVFETIDKESPSFGFLPVENSIVGNVAHNTELIYSRDVQLMAELYFPINHCLLGIKGSQLEQIKEVSSHPIALAQCRDYLRTKKIHARACDDTAGSAKHLAESQDSSLGAIASELCAQLYGLEVLARNIQKVQYNYTRFFLFEKKSHRSLNRAHNKVTLAFQTHHRPGALLEILKIFSDHRVNLTKLESRPDPNNPFTYFFTVDFLANLNEESTKLMLSELREEALTVKVLGAYLQAFIPKL